MVLALENVVNDVQSPFGNFDSGELLHIFKSQRAVRSKLGHNGMYFSGGLKGVLLYSFLILALALACKTSGGTVTSTPPPFKPESGTFWGDLYSDETYFHPGTGNFSDREEGIAEKTEVKGEVCTQGSPSKEYPSLDPVYTLTHMVCPSGSGWTTGSFGADPDYVPSEGLSTATPDTRACEYSGGTVRLLDYVDIEGLGRYRCLGSALVLEMIVDFNPDDLYGLGHDFVDGPNVPEELEK